LAPKRRYLLMDKHVKEHLESLTLFERTKLREVGHILRCPGLTEKEFITRQSLIDAKYSGSSTENDNKRLMELRKKMLLPSLDNS